MKLLYFSLLLFPIFIFAQSPSERQEIEQALLQYQELDNHPQLMLLERSLQKSEAALGKADTTTAKVYRELSECHYRNRNYEQALAYSLACLDALKSIEKYPERTAQAYTLAAKNLEQDIEKSKDYYQSSINLRSNRDNPANFENYIGMVRAYAFEGNYHMQLEYGKKAKELVQNPKQECEALEAIFGAYARLRNTKQGMINIESRLNISKTYGLTYQKGKAYSSLGWLKMIESKYGEAIKYFDKCISIITKDPAYNTDKLTVTTVANCYSNMSNAYRRLKKPELSIQYAKLSLQELESFYNKKVHPDMGRLYHNLANKYAWQKDYTRDFEAALRQQQNAIKCFLNDETFDDVREPVSKEQFYKVKVKWELLRSVKEKAHCYIHLYFKHRNREDLINADKHFSNAIELIDIIREELSSGQTKNFWRGKTAQIYNDAIEIAQLLDDVDKVHTYMEKSRSMQLLDELNHKEALDFIPKYLSEREKKLRNGFADSKDNVVEKFADYNAFLDSLKWAYPNYYKYKFDIKTPSIEEIQKELLTDSSQVLQYHMTNDSLFILNITNTDSELITSPISKTLNKDIKHLLSLINNKDSLELQSNFEKFIKLSTGIYDILFAPITQRRKEVVILGDGMINYLPFDVLIKEMEGGRPHYLIRDHSFSTAPSMAVLMKYKKDYSFKNLLMVSPQTFGNLGLGELVQSDEEMASLSKFANAKVLMHEDATLTKFKSLCHDFDVIHFSSHSGLDSLQKPWIAFKNSLISLNEIYKLKLNASLVTLSSCKSFDGKNHSGEGVNSLARAFLFADASAVIGSAWDLNEASGLYVFNAFYEGLKEGKTKPTALRKGKLDYIKNNPYKSPYYWAPLVLIGDPSSLSSAADKSYWGYAFAGLGLFLVLLLIKRFI